MYFDHLRSQFLPDDIQIVCERFSVEGKGVLKVQKTQLPETKVIPFNSIPIQFYEFITFQLIS